MSIKTSKSDLSLQNTLSSKVQYAMPVNVQAGTTYTFLINDAERLTTATNASVKTFTIPPQSSVRWIDNSIIRIVNYGVGALTIAGGSGVTVTNTAMTLAQFESAAAIRTGSNAWTLVPFGTRPQPPSSVEYLIIAGGGSGGGTGNGQSEAGGGGAGGYRCSVPGELTGGGGAAENVFSITAGTTYTVTVGAGGAASSGSDSSFGTIVATGGGRGGNIYQGLTGLTGGSGGGSGTWGGNAPAGGARVTNPIQGNNGGGNNVPAGDGVPFPAGGGGGAGGVGQGGKNVGNSNGGAGLASLITGASVTRAVGGRGTGSGAGAAFTGNGGAGGLAGNWAGGSGVIVIRQNRLNAPATTTGNPTVSTVGEHIVYVFNASGTIGW